MAGGSVQVQCSHSRLSPYGCVDHTVHARFARDPSLFCSRQAEGEIEKLRSEDCCDIVDQDLMQWCDDLDYDKYISDWKCMATTMASDAFIPMDEILPEIPAWTTTHVLSHQQHVHV